MVAEEMKRTDRCCNKVVPRPKRNRKSKAKLVGDEFQRLPDELLLSIFTMSDFKFVCQCSLVCKRFASIITLMQNVTVDFTSKECEISDGIAHIRNVFDKKLCPHSHVTPKMDVTCLRQTLKFINCIRKFKELTSVQINFSYGMGTSSSTLLEWKAKFGPELEYVVALLPTSIQKKTKQELSQEQEVGDVPWVLTESELEQSLYLAYGCCQEIVVRQTILYMLIEHHSMLRSVTIMDSEKQGQLCIQDEQLLELRNRFKNKDLEQIFEEVKIPHIFKVGYVPVVRLPELGYLLKGVILLIFKPDEEPSTNGEDVNEDSGLLAWQFDGEEVFRETVREVLVNHKDRMHLVPRAPRDAAP